MKRISFFFSLLLVCALFANAPAAHAGIFEFLFPSLKEEEYDPTKEMVAEFAAGKGAEDKEQLEQLPVDAIPLVNPHMLNPEVGEWVMNVAVEAMNFDAATTVEGLDANTGLFDATAKQQYLTFLSENNIQRAMTDGRFNIRSYANNTPLLLNEGVVNERYRWLYRVPVVVTYMDKDMTTYKQKQAALIQQATLNVQIGRVISPDHADGLQVEQWSGKLEAFKAPEQLSQDFFDEYCIAGLASDADAVDLPHSNHFNLLTKELFHVRCG